MEGQVTMCWHEWVVGGQAVVRQAEAGICVAWHETACRLALEGWGGNVYRQV